MNLDQLNNHFDQKADSGISSYLMSAENSAGHDNERRIDFENYLRYQLPKLYASAEILPYHGWSHIESLLKRAESILGRISQFGCRANPEILYHSILFHDILHHLDAQALGFPSKEALAAEYAFNTLRSFHFPPEHAQAVKDSILSTHPSSTPQGPEQILMRAVDLAGLTSPYEVFRDDTRRLYLENLKPGYECISEAQFALKSIRHLAHYLCPVLEMSPDARTIRGTSAWHEQALQNILQLYHDSTQTNPEVIIDFAYNPANPGKTSCNPSSLVICFEELEQSRRKLLMGAPEAYDNCYTALLALPIDCGMIPLQNSTVDKVILRLEDLARMQEISRVLKTGGLLELDSSSEEVNSTPLLDKILSIHCMKKSDGSAKTYYKVHAWPVSQLA